MTHGGHWLFSDRLTGYLKGGPNSIPHIALQRVHASAPGYVAHLERAGAFCCGRGTEARAQQVAGERSDNHPDPFGASLHSVRYAAVTLASWNVLNF
jgi:hypothetical protein